MDEEDLACDWWDRLAPDRRVQIYRWVTQNKNAAPTPIPGQLALIHEGKEET